MALSKPSAADVIALVGGDYTEPFVQAIIDDAALLADNPCVASYPAERQTALLKWLAAHLLTSTHDGGMLASEKLGDAQDNFARATLGEGLKGTVYGQQVLLLDQKGCLSRLGKARASIEVV